MTSLFGPETFYLCGEERPDLIDYYPDSVRQVLMNKEYSVIGGLSSYSPPSPCPDLDRNHITLDVDGDGIEETKLDFSGYSHRNFGWSEITISSSNPDLQWNTQIDTTFIDTSHYYIGHWETGYSVTTKDKADTFFTATSHKLLTTKELSNHASLSFSRDTLIYYSTWRSMGVCTNYSLGNSVRFGNFYLYSIFKLPSGEKKAVQWFTHSLIHDPDGYNSYRVFGVNGIYNVP